MNAVLAVEAIAKYLEEQLVDLRPEDDHGNERKITVYRYNFPEPDPAQMTASESNTALMAAAEPDPTQITAMESDPAGGYKGMMPAVVVSPIGYEDKALEDGSSLLTVSIMASAFSKDPMNVKGPWAVLNILERIRRLLLTCRIVGDAFEIQEPLGWQMYDESTRPIWLGEMTTLWRILTPFRIDSSDWKGDFLKGE